MPDYVVQRLISGLNDRGLAVSRSRILILGLAYKANTGDARESPAVRIANLLVSQGADVRAVDPYVEAHRFDADGFTLVELTAAEVDAADAVAIVTDHDCFDYDLIKHADAFVLDTRRRLGGRRESL